MARYPHFVSQRDTRSIQLDTCRLTEWIPTDTPVVVVGVCVNCEAEQGKPYVTQTLTAQTEYNEYPCDIPVILGRYALIL